MVRLRYSLEFGLVRVLFILGLIFGATPASAGGGATPAKRGHQVAAKKNKRVRQKASVRRHRAKKTQQKQRRLPVASMVRTASADATAPRARAAGKKTKRLARVSKKRVRTRRRPRCRAKVDRFPPMELYHANFRKALSLRVYDRCGRAEAGVREKMRDFLKCFRTRTRHSIDWRLISRLYAVSRRYKGKKIFVYSGYRHPRVAFHKKSRHTMGRAIDLRVAGVGNRQLRDFIMKRFGSVGVGYYPNTPFVHLDVGRKKSAFWIDWSSKGEDARYASDARKLLAQDRKGQPIREPRRVWVVIKEADSRSGAGAQQGGASARLAGGTGAPAAKCEISAFDPVAAAEYAARQAVLSGGRVPQGLPGVSVVLPVPGRAAPIPAQPTVEPLPLPPVARTAGKSAAAGRRGGALPAALPSIQPLGNAKTGAPS